MSQDINRLLMEIEHKRRAINREIINPVIPKLTVEDLRPMICLVANARARYLETLMTMGKEINEGRPSESQLDELAARRREYDELVNAAKALETAIQRGYLDVETKAR